MKSYDVLFFLMFITHKINKMFFVYDLAASLNDFHNFFDNFPQIDLLLISFFIIFSYINIDHYLIYVC